MSSSRDDLEQELDRTREHLAETVDALTDRLDVKSRAKEKVAEVKDAAQHSVQDDPQRTARLVAAALAMAIGVIIFRSGS